MAKAIKYGDGSFGMGTEWLHDFIFDRFRLLAANPLETALFRSKAGDTRNGSVLSPIDTNNKGDRVPTAQKWYLWNMEITYQNPALVADATLQLVFDFLRLTLLLFKIENLDTMFSAPLSYFRPTLQIASQPAATINTHAAMEDNRGGKEFRVPLVLEQNAVWHMDLIQTAASGGALDNSFLLFTFDREMYRQGG